MTNQQIAAARMLADAIVEAVKTGGNQGAPGGVMYAAMMAHVTLSQFESIMSGLVRVGRLRRQGDLYFVQEG